MQNLFRPARRRLLCSGASAGTTIDLTADASRPATNDMVRATLYAEASGSNPAELARRVNQEIAEALKTIKAKAGGHGQERPSEHLPGLWPESEDR